MADQTLNNNSYGYVKVGFDSERLSWARSDSFFDNALEFFKVRKYK